MVDRRDGLPPADGSPHALKDLSSLSVTQAVELGRGQRQIYVWRGIAGVDGQVMVRAVNVWFFADFNG
jgi:hypothetical protein